MQSLCLLPERESPFVYLRFFQIRFNLCYWQFFGGPRRYGGMANLIADENVNKAIYARMNGATGKVDSVECGIQVSPGKFGDFPVENLYRWNEN